MTNTRPVVILRSCYGLCIQIDKHKPEDEIVTNIRPVVILRSCYGLCIQIDKQKPGDEIVTNTRPVVILRSCYGLCIQIDKQKPEDEIVTNTRPVVILRSCYGLCIQIDKQKPEDEIVTNTRPVAILRFVLFIAWLLNVPASVSQGRICSDKLTCCRTEIEVADPTFYLTQSQYTDTGPTSPRTDPISPGAWQGSHWSANL